MGLRPFCVKGRKKMLRQEGIEEIWDGRLYTSLDMAKADCHGCEGCHTCCCGMGESVVLDPLDVWRLCTHLHISQEELIGRYAPLGYVDGCILPHLAMQGADERCIFLNEEGRCSVHAARPGFCRMFPLGRYYHDATFHYILQIHECPCPTRTKIKIKKWLDTPELGRYEAFALSWHDLLADSRSVMQKAGEPEMASI